MSTEQTVPITPRKPPALVNGFVKFLLQTPLHAPLSKRLMLLTFTGRASGKRFTTPIGYQRAGNTVTCFTDHPWWKNLLPQPEVTLHIKGQTLEGRAEVIKDDIDAIAHELEQHIRFSPMTARAFNIAVDEQKRPLPASLRQAAHAIALIRIHLNT